MKKNNVFSMEIETNELGCLIGGIARLTDGLNQCFIDDGTSLTDINPETGRPDAAMDWIIINYETLSGSISLLSSLSELLLRIYLEKDITITDRHRSLPDGIK